MLPLEEADKTTLRSLPSRKTRKVVELSLSPFFISNPQYFQPDIKTLPLKLSKTASRIQV
jgi:hypothetical protein